ncbi:MAG: DUF2303 family protein [Rhodospirillales bacterium]|nr:DUF2303 family protein [Rhodospirillales bacterium]
MSDSKSHMANPDLKTVQHIVVTGNTSKGLSHAYAVLPPGYSIREIEGLQERPNRARADVSMHSPDDLLVYYNRFCEQESMMFADIEACRIAGVIDWHEPPIRPGLAKTATEEATPAEPAAALFRQHRVSWQAKFDKRWKAWTGADGKAMTQREFAHFIEDNQPDIVEPDGATVLEVARHLDAKKGVDFTSAVDLQSGAVQFGYAEEVRAETRKGNIEVPAQFMIGIPVFLYGELYKVTARLRYRITEAKLSLWFDLVHPDRVRDDAFMRILEKVTVGMDRGELVRGTHGI